MSGGGDAGTIGDEERRTKIAKARHSAIVETERTSLPLSIMPRESTIIRYASRSVRPGRTVD